MTLEISYNWVQTTRIPPRNAEPIPPLQVLVDQYARHSQEIDSRHNTQTIDDVAALRRKYAAPILGRVSPWSLVESLGRCIDPTDRRLYGASQHLHVLQIIDAMEEEGAASDEMVLIALVHDLGKVLLLTDEAPENIVCMNQPIRVCAPGGGLDNCVFQWNHDEFAYSRLKDYLPGPLAWLVRYHSIVPETCETYMDARDQDYYQRYLKPFSRYDHGTKSPFYLPRRRLADYRHIVERALPASIAF